MDNVQKTVYKVGDFLSWMKAGTLELSPKFQRRPVWPKGAKSYLMDTILRAIPMPIVFLRSVRDSETYEARRQVVDGQQRIRTVISFVDSSLLPDLTEADTFTIHQFHNAELGGVAFRKLPKSAQAAILDYEFSVAVLPADTDDREVLQIFSRMNATGLKLNEQELRNAEFFGLMKQSLYTLATEQLNRWRLWGVFTETQIARMIEVEETSDLAITMVDGLHGKNQGALTQFYRTYNEKCVFLSELERRFRAVMDAIEDRAGIDIAASPFHRRPLFNTLFTFVYDEMFGLGSRLTRAVAKPLPRNLGSALDRAAKAIRSQEVPEDLANVLRGATNHLPARTKRLDFLRTSLKSRG